MFYQNYFRYREQLEAEKITDLKTASQFLNDLVKKEIDAARPEIVAQLNEIGVPEEKHEQHIQKIKKATQVKLINLFKEELQESKKDCVRLSS
jgi:hypothetical protein